MSVLSELYECGISELMKHYSLVVKIKEYFQKPLAQTFYLMTISDIVNQRVSMLLLDTFLTA